MKDLLSINNLDKDAIISLIVKAKHLKARRKFRRDLKNKNLLLMFEKPSLRTKVSFEVAIRELSGNCYYLSKDDIGFGKREAIKDMALVLSRYVDCCIVRTFKQEDLAEFADAATIPVVNGLTNSEHPVQILSDLLTIYEKTGSFNGFKVAFVGDGNNIGNSLIQSAGILGFQLSIATPKGYEPKEGPKQSANINFYNNPKDAVKDADFVYTDVWTSMGWEDERESRKKIFSDFQINSGILQNISKKCYIMHCLPAHRGEEITDAVIDSENSIVIDQAENRLHMHKAILIAVLSGIR
ncbi:MAG TPA: ornithine carbamoyltransferase [Candidatus Omnitrophica bacterium]|nr:ornithine carbamoyltransferase [Candidatus Omnitrophota bacterium]